MARVSARASGPRVVLVRTGRGCVVLVRAGGGRICTCEALGCSAQLRQRQLRAPGDPAGQRRSATFGGVRSGPSQIEQLSDLAHRRPRDPGLACKGGDPLFARHRSQLSRPPGPGRECR